VSRIWWKAANCRLVAGISMQFGEGALYRRVESYVSHHLTSKHQCMHLGSEPNLNSQASSPINEGWKPSYHIWKQVWTS